MEALPSGETTPAAATAGPHAAPPATTPARARALLLATFTAAIFVSAALLFMVQPMFTKMVLPRFGGAPSVWSVAIVFFQAALLAGYAYAHWLTRFAPGRPSVVIHLAVMLVAIFALPLSIASVNHVVYDGLGPDLQEAIDAAGRQTEIELWLALSTRLQENYQRMRQNGVTIDSNPAPAVVEAFQSGAAAAQRAWCTRSGPICNQILDALKAAKP